MTVSKKSINTILLAATAICCQPAAADLVAHYPMEVDNGEIVESISGKRYAVEGHFAPENVAGAVGDALRFDGYTSYVDAGIGNVLENGCNTMTVSLWAAVPCYPIIKIDVNTPEKTAIVSCIDETSKTGFGFFIGFDGKWQFRTYVGGWPVEVNIDTPLPTYQWNNLVAVVDGPGRTVKVYNNGELVGSSRCNGNINFVEATLRMGRGELENFSGPFLLTSYNGLLDDIKVWNEALPESTIQGWKAENAANLDIPASRFANDKLRPRFHGMPAAGWTNECHGMTFSDGRYHLFFQKNADGPYMARLHWGHISSENLYDWREEKIAIAPGDAYDIKGCWSGCVFTDPEITGNLPAAIYTGVDYVKASIDGASPTDATLQNWTKWSSNPIISGCPDGLSDDFRDPYFFRHNGSACIIVGSSKNNIGTTTLHRYDPATKTWNSDGLFFSGTSQASDGRFWEMPNITPLPNGKWIFTATPLETSQGVRTLYWLGNISDEGRFVPDAGFASGKLVELNSRDGYGLLSPTIYNHDGKTIVLGIVPDKLPSQENWNLGWAHCYSLPREWSIGADGLLSQKPYSGLEGMRGDVKFERDDFQLEGSLALGDVNGREAEISATFVIGTQPVGFKLFKSGDSEATVRYVPSSSTLEIDFSKLNRIVNDGWSYNGVYTCQLPEFQKAGSEMKINIFVDHSILDIFINDRWATSVRVFPTDADANGMEIFSESGACNVKELRAWKIDSSSFSGVGVERIVENAAGISLEAYDGSLHYSGLQPGDAVSVYDLTGRKIFSTRAKAASGSVATSIRGIHIVHAGGQARKVMFR